MSDHRIQFTGGVLSFRSELCAGQSGSSISDWVNPFFVDVGVMHFFSRCHGVDGHIFLEMSLHVNIKICIQIQLIYNIAIYLYNK